MTRPWLLLPLLLLAASARAEDEVIPLSTERREFVAWALDEESGAFLGALPRDGAVVEFDAKTGLERRAFACAVPEWGAAMQVKAKRLLVCDPRRGAVLAHDLATGKRAFEVAVPGARQLLVAAAVAEPSVWVLGVKDRRCLLAQLDVAKGVVAREVALPPGLDDSSLGALSHDGRLLLLRSSWQSQLLALEGASASLLALRRDDAQAHFVAALPHGRGWIVGPRVLQHDLTPVGPTWEGSPAFHPARDLAVVPVESQGRRGRAVALHRASTGERLTTLEVGQAGRGHGSMVLIDGARDRALCTFGPEAFLLDLSATPTAPALLLAARPCVAALEVGAALEVEVTSARGGAAPTLTLVDPPDGAKLDGAKLAWRPTSAQVGRHRLVVQGKQGESQDEVSVLVDVRHPSIALGFPVGQLVTDPAGQRLLAISGRVDDPHGQRQPEPPALALIDVAGLKVGAQRKLDREARLVLLAGESAFVLQQRPNVLLRLKGADLSDDARGFHRGLNDLTLLGDRLVGTFTGESSSFEAGVVGLDARSFDEVWRLGLQGHSLQGTTRTADGGALLGGVLLVRPDGAPRALTGAVAYLPAVFARMPDGFRQQQYQAPVTRHPTLPVTFVATREQLPEAWKVGLEVRDLAGKRVHATHVTNVSFHTPLPSSHLGWSPPMAGVGDRVVIGIGDRLHVVPLPATLAALTRPLEVLPAAEKPLALKHDAPAATVPFRASGGKGPYKFELEGPVAGVTVDPATGAATIDPAAAWKTFLEGSVRGQQQHQWDKERARPVLELVGADPAAVPLLVGFAVVARDAEQQHARCPYVAVVAGDPAALQKAVEEAQAKARAAAPTPMTGDARVDLARLEQELRALRLAQEATKAEAAKAADALKAAEAAKAAAEAAKAEAAKALAAAEAAKAAAEAPRAAPEAGPLRDGLEAARRDVAALQGEARALTTAHAAQGSRADLALGLGTAGLVAGLLGLALARRAPPKGSSEG